MKKLLSLVLALVVLTCLCACQKEETKGNESQILVEVYKDDSIEINAEQSVFPQNTTIKIEEITDGKSFNTAKSALKEKAEKFVAYDITAQSENVSVQPDGTAYATFEIPDDYILDNVAVVYVSEDGKTENVKSTVNKDTKTVTAELMHFSIYAVVEVTADAQAPTVSDISSEPEVSSEPESSSKPANNTSIKKGVWVAYEPGGNRVYEYELSFGGEEPWLTIGFGDNMKDFDAEFKKSILESGNYCEYNGNYYYFGMGDGCPISYTEDGDKVTIKQNDTTNTVTIERIGEKSFKVTEISGKLCDVEALKVGSVFNYKEAKPSED